MLGTTIALAMREILRHKMRSFLTTLGIIIGVAAVVTMVTLGNGATTAVTNQISALGANILQLRPGQGFGRGGGGPRPPAFKDQDVSAIASQIAGVRAVAPQAQTSGTAVYGGNNWTTTINGTTAAFFEAQQWQLQSGRLFLPEEELAGKSVCIIGNTLRANVFKQVDPIGKRFRINGISCQVVGLLATRGQSGFGQDQDDVVVMPIKLVERRLTGNRDIGMILIAVDSAYDSAAVQTSLEGLMRERRRIKPGTQDNFSVFDTKQISDTLTGTTRILTEIVTAVAAISLVVGGIGIMNIMLVSVTERTREIGIRLAIGAVAREVLLQFLVEAVVLSCMGGVMGLVIAFIAAALIAPLMQVPAVFDLQINLLAFLFSAAIGVVFGYFPARRAAQLNPIDALRHE
jgi:putative ABC transport system permease protein